MRFFLGHQIGSIPKWGRRPFEGRGGGVILGVIRNNRNKVSIYITPFFSARNAPFLLSDVASLPFFFMAPAFFVCFFSVQQGNRSRLSIFLGGGSTNRKEEPHSVGFFFGLCGSCQKRKLGKAKLGVGRRHFIGRTRASSAGRQSRPDWAETRRTTRPNRVPSRRRTRRSRRSQSTGYRRNGAAKQTHGRFDQQQQQQQQRRRRLG